MRFRSILVLLLSAGCASCGGMSASVEEEIVSSLRYDHVPCSELASQRDALVARYGYPDTPGEPKPGERPGYLATGLGTVLPDMRGAAARERGLARGKIEAMNHSLTRRQCAGAPPAE